MSLFLAAIVEYRLQGANTLVLGLLSFTVTEQETLSHYAEIFVSFELFIQKAFLKTVCREANEDNMGKKNLHTEYLMFKESS